MSVIAPPRPPHVSVPAGHDPGEALIKEAKQRARRRRWLWGGAAAVVVAAVAVAGFSTFPSSPSPPHRAARDVPAQPPLVKGSDPASTLLASWGRLHVGYVFVYADGRVIWHPAGGVYVDDNGRVTGHAAERAFGPQDPLPITLLERQLSPRGLKLVRAGKFEPKPPIDPSTLPVGYDLYRRNDVWAEPTVKAYEPSTYAICAAGRDPVPGTIQGPGYLVDATLLVDQLPAPALDLLNGKQRTYDPNVSTAQWLPGGTPGGRVTCFEVTAAENSTLQQILKSNGWSASHWNGLNWAAHFDEFQSLVASPVFPHGQPLFILGG